MTAFDILGLPRTAGEKRTRVGELLFAGLDRRRTVKSGSLSDCRNGDTTFLPALRTARGAAKVGEGYTGALGAYSDGECRMILYRSGTDIVAERTVGASTVTAVLKPNAAADHTQRTVVAFNRYSDPLDPLSGSYEKMLLIFPDGVWCRRDNAALTFTSIGENVPHLDHATVACSRVFGVDGDRVYASAFNDPTDWELDTAGDISAQNAWATTSQSDTRASGGFSAIAAFDGAAVCFRDDWMQQVYNNKNPFRLVDIGRWGCLGDYAHCDFGDRLAFVSRAGVFLYGGGYPVSIADKLAVTDFTGAMLTASRDLLYLYLPAEGRVFVYEPTSESWGERELDGVTLLFTDGSRGYAITDTGALYALDGGDYGSFTFTTDRKSLGVTDPKKLCGIAVTAELENDATLAVVLTTADGDRTVVSSATAGLQVLRTALTALPSDFVSLTFTGTGRVDLYALALSYAATRTAGGAG